MWVSRPKNGLFVVGLFKKKRRGASASILEYWRRETRGIGKVLYQVAGEIFGASTIVSFSLFSSKAKHLYSDL